MHCERGTLLVVSQHLSALWETGAQTSAVVVAALTRRNDGDLGTHVSLHDARGTSGIDEAPASQQIGEE